MVDGSDDGCHGLEYNNASRLSLTRNTRLPLTVALAFFAGHCECRPGFWFNFGYNIV